MKKRHEVLFNQLESYRSEILGVADTVSEEDAEKIPAGFNNNIRWNLGHIYLDQYLWIQALTKEPADVPEEFKTWFATAPLPPILPRKHQPSVT